MCQGLHPPRHPYHSSASSCQASDQRGQLSNGSAWQPAVLHEWKMGWGQDKINIQLHQYDHTIQKNRAGRYRWDITARKRELSKSVFRHSDGISRAEMTALRGIQGQKDKDMKLIRYHLLCFEGVTPTEQLNSMCRSTLFSDYSSWHIITHLLSPASFVYHHSFFPQIPISFSTNFFPSPFLFKQKIILNMWLSTVKSSVKNEFKSSL